LGGLMTEEPNRPFAHPTYVTAVRGRRQPLAERERHFISDMKQHAMQAAPGKDPLPSARREPRHPAVNLLVCGGAWGVHPIDGDPPRTDGDQEHSMSMSTPRALAAVKSEAILRRAIKNR